MNLNLAEMAEGAFMEQFNLELHYLKPTAALGR